MIITRVSISSKQISMNHVLINTRDSRCARCERNLENHEQDGDLYPEDW